MKLHETSLPFFGGLEVSSEREKVSIFTLVYCSIAYHSVGNIRREILRLSELRLDATVCVRGPG